MRRTPLHATLLELLRRYLRPPTSSALGVRNGAGYPRFYDAGPLLLGPAMGPAGFTYPSPRRVRAASFVDTNSTGFGLAAELYSIGVANAAFLKKRA